MKKLNFEILLPDKPTIIFFGSFLHYSAKILKALHESPNLNLAGAVTTPPKPAGRDQTLKKTPVHEYAIANKLPVFTPEKLDQASLDKLKHQTSNIKHSANQPDLFIVAGYSKLLPPSWLNYPKLASLNVHFSLLPKYRGAMPAEWAILMGEKQTGVTLMEMAEKFDTGRLISQQSIPIDPKDTRETLYEKLYTLGTDLTLQVLPFYLNWKKTSKVYDDSNHRINRLTDQQINRSTKLFLPPKKQSPSPTPWARLLSKQDSFIPWRLIQKATTGKKLKSSDKTTPLLDTVRNHLTKSNPNSLHIVCCSLLIEHATRALSGYPGLWTKVKTSKGEKRLKLLSSHIKKDLLHLDQVQLEGKKPTSFNEIKNNFKNV